MPTLIRTASTFAVLALLAACQVTGAAPPSSAARNSGTVELGAPGSNAP
jgi:hypothetical protein